MSERLPSSLEATALLRRVESMGGFGAVIRRGDPDRGTLSLMVAERGRPAALLERRLAADFSYRWTVSSEGEPWDEVAAREFAERLSRIDPDAWLIELDVADAQRFIAETIAEG